MFAKKPVKYLRDCEIQSWNLNWGCEFPSICPLVTLWAWVSICTAIDLLAHNIHVSYGDIPETDAINWEICFEKV